MPDKATAAAAGGEDRLSALPDDVLLLVLSSLPSDDAVRMSVLAHRWRHLWRSTRAVRIARRDWREGSDRWTPWTLNAFVNRLLHLRGGAPLDEFEIDCGDIDGGGMEDIINEGERYRWTWERNEELSRFAGAWIQHVLSFCQAKGAQFLRPALADRGRLRRPPPDQSGPHRRHSQVSVSGFLDVPGVGGSGLDVLQGSWG
ncbi:hypothetical protein SEVIR_8G073590v4 [Setaria viridis]